MDPIKEAYGLFIAFTRDEPNAATEDARKVRREISWLLHKSEPDGVKRLALKLVRDRRPWARFFAYEIIHNHKPALHSLTETEVEQLGEGVDSWFTVDTFGSYVSGPAWRLGIVSDKAVAKWAKSEDVWWRRTSLVSTVALNMKSLGGSGDIARTTAICTLLIDDREDMVVKAMSWALRALARPFPADAAQFLETHRKSLAPRVIRELEHKVKTGRKNPRRVPR